MKQLSWLFSNSQRGPRALVVLLGLAVVVLVLASCTASAAQQPAAQPAAVSAAPPTAAPVQASSQSVTSSVENFVSTPKEVTVSASPLPLGSYTNDKTEWGTLVLTLADGGQFTLNIGLTNELIQGAWKMTGDQIDLTATNGGCPNIKGTYKWALHGNDLTFKQVHDSCLYNTAIFDSQTWTRQP